MYGCPIYVWHFIMTVKITEVYKEGCPNQKDSSYVNSNDGIYIFLRNCDFKYQG